MLIRGESGSHEVQNPAYQASLDLKLLADLVDQLLTDMRVPQCDAHDPEKDLGIVHHARKERSMAAHRG